MKKNIRFKVIISFIALILPITLAAQSVTFTVTTLTYNGQFSPFNCFAIWITKADGTYVKTINRQSSSYTYYLSNWRINSDANMTDGQTGATLTRHNEPYFDEGVMRIPFLWNCKDFNGMLVPDGDYYVNVEFTENDGTGKYMKYIFTKGLQNNSISYPNTITDPAIYFRNAVLTYTAPTTGVNIAKEEKKPQINFNASTKILQITNNTQLSAQTRLFIYDSKGTFIQSKIIYYSPASIKLSTLAAGNYIVKLVDKNNYGIISHKISIK